MKCPFCAVRVKKDEPLELLGHVALTHTAEIKIIYEKMTGSEVVWVMPTPEPPPAQEDEVQDGA